jgi:hypothetical protein
MKTPIVQTTDDAIDMLKSVSEFILSEDFQIACPGPLVKRMKRIEADVANLALRLTRFKRAIPAARERSRKIALGL